MNRIFYSIIYVLSLLPLRVLYGFSGFLYFLMNYVFRYRKDVIQRNLQSSFPGKSEDEIKKIHKKFNRNLTDYIAEMLKSFSITQKELDKRHTYSNLEVFDECKAENKNVVLITGHVFNWEWFLGLVNKLPTKYTYALYHSTRNSFWDGVTSGIRSKFGTTPLNMYHAVRQMMKTENNGEHTYLFVADQSPKKAQIKYNLTFLNQETPVYTGFDKITVRKDMAVVFCKTVKQKQGYYHTSFERILPDAEKFREFEVVEKFFSKLEKQIRENPDNWLWSHKRWKNLTDYKF